MVLAINESERQVKQLQSILAAQRVALMAEVDRLWTPDEIIEARRFTQINA